MYVDIDVRHRVHLMDMTRDEALALKEMIEGSGLLHRQAFWRVRQELCAMPAKAEPWHTENGEV